jgi:hypothetical protein
MAEEPNYQANVAASGTHRPGAGGSVPNALARLLIL